MARKLPPAQSCGCSRPAGALMCRFPLAHGKLVWSPWMPVMAHGRTLRIGPMPDSSSNADEDESPKLPQIASPESGLLDSDRLWYFRETSCRNFFSSAERLSIPLLATF